MPKVLKLESVRGEPRVLEIGDEKFPMPLPEDIPVGVELKLREIRRRMEAAEKAGDAEAQIECLRDQVRAAVPTITDAVIDQLSIRDISAIIEFAWTGNVTRTTEAAASLDEAEVTTAPPVPDAWQASSTVDPQTEAAAPPPPPRSES